MPVMGLFDPMKGRLPMLIFSVFYCAFVMPRFCPDRAVENDINRRDQVEGEWQPMSVLSEIAGIVIFFATALALMFQANILSFLSVWQICLAGAVCMVIFRVLQPGEAVRAIPLSMLLLIVGTLAMAGALSATGAGDLIGGFITDFTTAVKINNKYIIGLIFFLLSFLLAQFMSNRGAMLIFYRKHFPRFNVIFYPVVKLGVLVRAGMAMARRLVKRLLPDDSKPVSSSWPWIIISGDPSSVAERASINFFQDTLPSQGNFNVLIDDGCHSCAQIVDYIRQNSDPDRLAFHIFADRHGIIISPKMSHS